MEIEYRVFLEEEGFLFLQSLKKSEQRQILAEIRRLRQDPFREGDFAASDSRGRPITGVLVGIHCILYWVDHGEKEIKVTEIRHADR